MTQDEIIEMADKSDEEADKVLNMKGEYHPNWHQVRDETFAKLVAAKEREACAKVCEELVIEVVGNSALAVDQCARTIRARGKDNGI